MVLKSGDAITLPARRNLPDPHRKGCWRQDYGRGYQEIAQMLGVGMNPLAVYLNRAPIVFPLGFSWDQLCFHIGIEQIGWVRQAALDLRDIGDSTIWSGAARHVDDVAGVGWRLEPRRTGQPFRKLQADVPSGFHRAKRDGCGLPRFGQAGR